MHVISEKALRLFWEAYPDAKEPLRTWLKITERSRWKNFAEVRQTFNSADIAGVYTIFDIRGNHYRLIACIEYKKGRVYIIYVFTHAEYDKWNARK